MPKHLTLRPACGLKSVSAATGQQFDLVFNAISASPRGELPPVPATVSSAHGLAYELAYGQGLAPFLRMAQQMGVRHLADGVGMLVEQAAEAFAWWRGIRPATQPAIRRLAVTASLSDDGFSLTRDGWP